MKRQPTMTMTMTGILEDGAYSTKEGSATYLSRFFPTLVFYRRMLRVMVTSSWAARRGRYDSSAWAASSLDIARALEAAGVRIEVSGAQSYLGLDKPCVFVSNHMSTFETFVLPCLIQPYREVTFIVKQSLVNYPVFGPIMRSRDPITVGRTNPRDDLKAVLEGGAAKLARGVSLIVFPQTTRTYDLDPERFNSIGVKLARKAQVPVVPVALETSAWGTGWPMKDFGLIRPERTGWIEFGEPIEISGNGAAEHEKVVEFIASRLARWRSSQ
jgi:1-acyl-sn-glycerol-3-phosphate acyltransferase